ncbi:MAG TPA: hypothetical protein VN783_09550 [Thermoanaerobaculia bacterium]|nr:hypothetical protein [Thermoanaerobaculia bacterium]
MKLRPEEPGAERPERRPVWRWLLVWLLLAAVYAAVRAVARLLLPAAGDGLAHLLAIDWREIAIVPALETLALAGVAGMRRAASNRIG